jgi:hypothetical protein
MPRSKFYKTPYGATKTLVASGTVDGSGDLATTVVMRKRSTFVAEWAGDGTYLSKASNCSDRSGTGANARRSS